jgi:TPR repeat protein
MAETWYRKAADAGVALAQLNLGVMYKSGHGIPQDYATALTWYRKAADAGVALAQRLILESCTRAAMAYRRTTPRR